MLKAAELRQLNTDELLEKAENLRKEHFHLRLAAKIGKLEKASQLRQVRRDIARVLTIHHELSRAGSEQALRPGSGQVPQKEKTVVKATPKKVAVPEKKVEKKGLFGAIKKKATEKKDSKKAKPTKKK